MREFKFCPDCAAQNERDAVACGQCDARFTWRDDLEKPLRVTVVDFDMKFGSMILFMVKWAVAAIPAMIILFFAVLFAFMFLGALRR
jgi:uncharacterized membrane protein YvbJ